MASIAPSLTSSNQYAWSVWFHKNEPTWSGAWESYFRISLDTTYRQLLLRIRSENLKFSVDVGIGRISGSFMRSTNDMIFTASTSVSPDYIWDPLENVILPKQFCVDYHDKSLDSC